MSRPRRCRVFAALALCPLFTGCIESAFFESLIPMDYGPVPQPELPGPTEGAIWPGDTQAGSFLFFDQKARAAGDLVTVVIEESLSAQGEAKTDLEDSSSLGANLSSDVGFHEFVVDKFRALFEALNLQEPGVDVPVGDELNVLETEFGNTFEGKGSTERSADFSGVITCRVINVLPGRLLHIRGRRMLHVNHEVQVVTVEGLVRQEDISINNTVRSTELAEARLTFDGIGVIDDRQRPGLVSRLFGYLFPF